MFDKHLHKIEIKAKYHVCCVYYVRLFCRFARPAVFKNVKRMFGHIPEGWIMGRTITLWSVPQSNQREFHSKTNITQQPLTFYPTIISEPSLKSSQKRVLKGPGKRETLINITFMNNHLETPVIWGTCEQPSSVYHTMPCCCAKLF